jgi:acetyl-CoA acetyltransferase
VDYSPSGGGAAVVGIGTIGFHRSTDESVATLTNRAVTAALADSGLDRSQLDGLFVHIGSPRGLDYDATARLLGLEVRMAAQSWSHGRFTATVLQHAALAVSAGLTDYALCVGAFRNSPFGRHGTARFPDYNEAMREGGGPHAEHPATGLVAPIGGAAMATTRYLHTYGIEREKLGAVALTQRAAASCNPLAVMQKPIDEHDYAASPYVVEPLRLLDCSVPVDTAVAVIITTTERAADVRPRAVRMLSYQGLRAGPNEFVFGQIGLGINQRDAGDYQPVGKNERVFTQAGVSPADVDALYCYDGFSPQVLWTLERFGFCAPGEAADWIQGGRIGLDGELPVNTCGGHLSEGHSNGWGQTIELVRQLRHEAGDRQIKDCAVAMWATTLGDAILYAA